MGLSVREIGDLIRIYERRGRVARNTMAAPLRAARLRALQAELVRVEKAVATVAARCAALGVSAAAPALGETPPPAVRRFRT